MRNPGSGDVCSSAISFADLSVDFCLKPIDQIVLKNHPPAIIC